MQMVYCTERFRQATTSTDVDIHLHKVLTRPFLKTLYFDNASSDLIEILKNP